MRRWSAGCADGPRWRPSCARPRPTASAQLGGLGLSDLAAAEDMLSREEAHVAAISGARGPAGWPRRARSRSRPSARPVTRRRPRWTARRPSSAALPPETVAPDARTRFEGEVRTAETAHETRPGRRGERARPGGREHRRSGPGRRRGGTAGDLARAARSTSSGRARIHEAALGGLERATEATMERATRYLETPDDRLDRPDHRRPVPSGPGRRRRPSTSRSTSPRRTTGSTSGGCPTGPSARSTWPPGSVSSGT